MIGQALGSWDCGVLWPLERGVVGGRREWDEGPLVLERGCGLQLQVGKVCGPRGQCPLRLAEVVQVRGGGL